MAKIHVTPCSLHFIHGHVLLCYYYYKENTQVLTPQYVQVNLKKISGLHKKERRQDWDKDSYEISM